MERKIKEMAYQLGADVCGIGSINRFENASAGFSPLLCGGFAIDAYLGKVTRKHKDIDITVSFHDMIECIRYLKSKGWEIEPLIDIFT